MFRIEFYEDVKGDSELWDFIEQLRIKSTTNKTARIEFNQISLYINLLSEHGTQLSSNITKHIEDTIWELRPGNNRIFYFCFDGETFVLLHQFRKKAQKTPRREIDRAISERDDYLSRKKGAEHI